MRSVGREGPDSTSLPGRVTRRRGGGQAHPLLGWQASAGNAAVTRVLRQGSVQRVLTVQRVSWIGQRVQWVRSALASSDDTTKWSSSDPSSPGAYYVLNGLSLDDMVSVLRSLQPAQRSALAANLDEHGGGFDRSRLQLALSNVTTDAGFRQASERLHWAIRSGNYASLTDGAFAQLSAAKGARRGQLLKALNRDALDALIANEDQCPDGMDDVLTAVKAARGGTGATGLEQHLLDLIDGRDWPGFYRAYVPLNATDRLRFLRGNFGAVAQISQHLDETAGIANRHEIEHDLELATTTESTSLYVDLFAGGYRWQPRYRAEGEDWSRIVRFGDALGVELDINTIGDQVMAPDAAQAALDAAQPGPGGLMWPAQLNRSTAPTLWKVKQEIHRQMEVLNFDAVLMAGITVVEFVLTALVPEAMGLSKLSVSALERGGLSARWMKGSLAIKPASRGASQAGRGIWDLGVGDRGRAAEAALAGSTPGEKFYGSFPNFDRAVYSAAGPTADAVEVGQLKSYDTTLSYKRPNSLYRAIMKDAGDLGGVGGTWEQGGKEVTLGPKTVRVLDVAIPDEALAPAKQLQIDRAVTDAATMDVHIRVHRIR